MGNLDIDWQAPNLTASLAEYQRTLEKIKSQNPSWQNTMEPLQLATNTVLKDWNKLTQLLRVASTPELSKLYQESLPAMTGFYRQLVSDRQIYEQCLSIKNSEQFKSLSPQQQNALEQLLLYFKLSGTTLSPDSNSRFWQIITELAKLSRKYADNLQRASLEYRYPVNDLNELAGVPQSYARELVKLGYINLHPRNLQAILSYCSNRSLREAIYRAYASLASQGKYDNTPVIKQILSLRQELAQLLGYANYLEYAIADKFAPSSAELKTYLNNEAENLANVGKPELNTLSDYANRNDGISELAAWDLAYYSELFILNHFYVNNKQQRQYFPLESVLKGLFSVTSLNFGLDFKELSSAKAWHPDVRLFAVYDKQQNLLGQLYADLLARPNKNQNTELLPYCKRLRFANGQTQTPIVFLNASFNAEQPLLDYQEISDLFNSFGQALQLLSSNSTVLNVAGFDGLSQDAALLSGYFLQDFAWNPIVAKDLSKNIKTSRDLPASVFNTLIAERNFNQAIYAIRQNQLALLDYNAHTSGNTKASRTILPTIADDKIINRFHEIFSGNMAGIYYSNSWAKHLAAKLYSGFAKRKLLAPKLGNKLRDTVWANGGQKSSLELYLDFKDEF